MYGGTKLNIFWLWLSLYLTCLKLVTQIVPLFIWPEMWDTMIEKVKTVIYRQEEKEGNDTSTFYEVVYNILIARWTKSLTVLHCMVHSLNLK